MVVRYGEPCRAASKQNMGLRVIRDRVSVCLPSDKCRCLDGAYGKWDVRREGLAIAVTGRRTLGSDGSGCLAVAPGAVDWFGCCYALPGVCPPTI